MKDNFWDDLDDIEDMLNDAPDGYDAYDPGFDDSYSQPGYPHREIEHNKKPSRSPRKGKRKFLSIIKWYLIACVALIIIVAIVSPSEMDEPGTSAANGVSDSFDATEETPESTSTVDADKAIDGIQYTLPCGLDVQFYDSVNNDMTGRWRVSTTYSTLAPEEYASEYYHTLFSADDEIHFVINYSLDTTTRFTYDSGVVFVTTFDHIDDEEEDANALPGGEILSEFAFYADTGNAFDLDEPTPTAEPETTPKPTAEPEPQAAAATVRGHPGDMTVYVSNSGKIHSVSDCSGMKNYSTMTLAEADAKGYEYCSNCW